MTSDMSHAVAAFSDAFQFPDTALQPGMPEEIEADRHHMAARPGLIRKELPLRQDATGVYCGGCYFFDSDEHARQFAHWVSHEYTTADGVLFPNRPQFLELTSQLWLVVGAEDFDEVATTHRVLRIERWHLSHAPSLEQLRDNEWPRIRTAAREAGLTSAQLLLGTDPYHPQLGLVTVSNGDPHDAAEWAEHAPSLHRMETLPSPAAELAQRWQATKVFNRTSWMYMIWHPIADGDTSPHTAHWPVSPPLPGLPQLTHQ